MRRNLSARSRLTLLYASLFALGGAALVSVTYLLVVHSLHGPTTKGIPGASQQAIAGCAKAAQTAGALAPRVVIKCAAVYANGVQAGASAQRSTTLTHLLAYSLLGLAGVTLLAAAAGWIVAGRILRPVHRLTAAARAASEQDLSQRSRCRARATTCASSPTRSTRCLTGSTARSPASGTSSPTPVMSFARR